MLTLLKREKTRWKIWSEPIWASQRNSRDWTLCLRVSQENSMISESDIAKLRVLCPSTKVLRLRWETMKTRLDYWQLSCRSWTICWRREIDRLALWKNKNYNYIARLTTIRTTRLKLVRTSSWWLRCRKATTHSKERLTAGSKSTEK